MSSNRICFSTAAEDTYYETFRKHAYPNYETFSVKAFIYAIHNFQWYSCDWIMFASAFNENRPRLSLSLLLVGDIRNAIPQQ